MEYGYWKCQGKSELSLYILKYLDKDFELCYYTNYPEWMKKKQHMQDNGFFSPSLPYLVDGEYMISESSAIPIYLLKKNNKSEMLGKNPEDIGRVQQIFGILEDQIMDLIFNHKAEDYRKYYDEKVKILQKRAECLSQFLGKKQYLLGYLTYVDFFLHILMKNYAEASQVLEVQDEFGKYENLQQHCENIYKLPELQKFFEDRKENPLPFMPSGRYNLPQKK